MAKEGFSQQPVFVSIVVAVADTTKAYGKWSKDAGITAERGSGA